MSIGMSFYPQVVVLKGKVYVGGGSAVSKDDNTVIMCYDIEYNKWTALSQYYNASLYFAMAARTEDIFLVGGRHPANAQTRRTIGVRNVTTLSWTNRFDFPSSIGRDALTAITKSRLPMITNT